MELSAPLRWLGALAVMVVVVVIVVPLLLDTIGDTVVLGDEATAGSSEAAEPSEVASDGAGGGGDGGGNAADTEFPAEYTVEAGDTGAAISEQFYGSPDGWDTIAEANDIDPSAPLRVGVELTIPPPE